jgi:phosphatidylserine decarboxylase
VLSFFIRCYCRRYKINTEEMAVPVSGFKTFDDFFTRRLKKGIHHIDRGLNAVVSPVDGRIDQFGRIEGTRIIQAKGIDFLISDLIPLPNSYQFIGGIFITLYLSPGDYHRIHSPVDGMILGGLHIPGKLFPVAELMVKGIRGIFSKNERIITFIQTKKGVCAVCKIGAMNVGRISVTYADMISNQKIFRGRREIFFKPEETVPVKKGGDLGTFHLGSTVILLFPGDMIILEKLKQGQNVRMGQKIGTINKKQ